MEFFLPVHGPQLSGVARARQAGFPPERPPFPLEKPTAVSLSRNYLVAWQAEGNGEPGTHILPGPSTRRRAGDPTTGKGWTSVEAPAADRAQQAGRGRGGNAFSV